MHACKADFLWKYEAELGSQYSNRVDGFGSGSVPSAAQLDEKQEQLRNEISSALSKSQELQKSFAILVRAKKDYEAKQKDR